MGGITLDPVLTATADKDVVSQRRLKGVCADFESIFITHMLKSMRKTVVENGLLGNTNESKIYQSMFDEKFAIQISRSGGMGLGEILFERLKDENLGALPQTPRPSRHEINLDGLLE